MAEYTVIDSVQGLTDAAARLAEDNDPVAVDVERASGFRYSQRAYLVQVYSRSAGLFLFDPPAIGDMTDLAAALAGREWVLHAASQDLASLREVGLDPEVIFDTELAARLLGYERVGLAAVAEATIGLTLEKAHSAADWSTRPLPQSWLEYAAHDVEPLIDVRDVMAGQLAEQGKERIAAQEFQATLDRAPKPPAAEPWRRLSGLHAVRGRRGLAVARALWTAREEYAQAKDTAPGRIVPDRSLVAAVLADPKSKHALAALKEFNGRESRSQLDRWWAAIEAGRAEQSLPAERVRGNGDSVPPARAWADRNPEADARLKRAKATLEQISHEHSIPLENLLTPDTLRRVAWAPPAEVTASSVGETLLEMGARPWQIEHTAQALAAAFVDSQHAGANDAAHD